MNSATNPAVGRSLISLLLRQLQARLQVRGELLIFAFVMLVGVAALVGAGSWLAGSNGNFQTVLRLTILLAFGGGLFVGYCRLPQIRSPLRIVKRSDWLWTVLAAWQLVIVLAALLLAGPAIWQVNVDTPGPWLALLLVSLVITVAAVSTFAAGLATIIRLVWRNPWIRVVAFLGTMFGGLLVINGPFFSPILTAFAPETNNQLFLVLLWSIGSLGVSVIITDQALASRRTVAERVGNFWFLRLSHRSFDQVASPLMTSLLTEWLRIGRDRHLGLRLATWVAVFFCVLAAGPLTSPSIIGLVLGLMIVTIGYTLAFGSPVTSRPPRLPYRHQFALSRALGRFLLASVIVLSLAISFALPLGLRPVNLVAIGFLTACISVVFAFADLVSRQRADTTGGRETQELVALLAALLVSGLFAVGWPLLSTSVLIIVLLAWTSLIIWGYQRYAQHQLDASA